MPVEVNQLGIETVLVLRLSGCEESAGNPVNRSISGVGAPGLGAGVTQIVDAAGLTVGGKEFLYFSARPPSGPLRLYRMAR